MQMAVAMRGYHEDHGEFPPGAVFDKDGKPLLSWRVLLLPYIAQDDLHRHFRLDEAWGSPHNLKLLARIPLVYEPFDGRATPQPHTTFFRVFVGAGAAFEGTDGLNCKADFP